MRITGRKMGNEITDIIHEYLRGCSDTQLRLLRKHIRRLTDSNCGWDIYALRQGLVEIVAVHLHSRTKQNRMHRKGVADRGPAA